MKKSKPILLEERGGLLFRALYSLASTKDAANLFSFSSAPLRSGRVPGILLVFQAYLVDSGEWTPGKRWKRDEKHFDVNHWLVFCRVGNPGPLSPILSGCPFHLDWSRHPLDPERNDKAGAKAPRRPSPPAL